MYDTPTLDNGMILSDRYLEETHVFRGSLTDSLFGLSVRVLGCILL